MKALTIKKLWISITVERNKTAVMERVQVFITIAAKLFPIFLTLLVGVITRRLGIFVDLKNGNDNFVGNIKTLVGNVLLPLVLFNAFFTAHYDLNTPVFLSAIYLFCGISLFVGNKFKNVLSTQTKYFPFLLTSYEGGMLGYPLYTILLGSAHLHNFAIFDIGNTLFAFTIFLVFLQRTDSVKVNLTSQIKTMLQTPAVVGMFSGIILGILGFAKLPAAAPFISLYDSCVGFITAPTGFLILLTIGYEVRIDLALLRNVLQTAVFRLAWQFIVAVILVVVLTFLFHISIEQRYAIYLLCSLPAPFIIPMFSDLKEDASYVASTYSLSTILTIIIFACLVVTYTNGLF